MTVSAIGLLVANSASAPVYFGILETNVGGLSILHWINDALMAVFFLVTAVQWLLATICAMTSTRPSVAAFQLNVLSQGTPIA